MVSSLHTELIKQSNLHQLPCLDLTCTAPQSVKATRRHLISPSPSSIHPSFTWRAMLTHLLCGFIPTSQCHLGLLWTHNICCRHHRRQLSPTCHDINTEETDSLRQSCARVHEAATPPAGWIAKHTPHFHSLIMDSRETTSSPFGLFMIYFFSVFIYVCELKTIVSHSSQ